MRDLPAIINVQSKIPESAAQMPIVSNSNKRYKGGDFVVNKNPHTGKMEQMFKFGDRGDILFPTIPLMIEHFMVHPYTQHSVTQELLILRPPNMVGKMDHIAKRVVTGEKGSSLVFGAGAGQTDN